MIELRSVDFKKMVVDISKAPPGTDMLKIPVYAAWPEFNESVAPINIDTLLRYIPCLYDQESPFVKQIADVRQRKYEAGVYAGFKMKDDKFSSEVEKMVIRCGMPAIARMIIRYCYLQRSVLFQEWILVNEANFKESEKILSDSAYSDISKLKTNSERLRELQEEFLMEDKERNLIEDFYGFHRKQTLDLRPEAIALRLREGKSPIE